MNIAIFSTTKNQISAEVKLRALIGVFIFLVWKLSEVMMPASTDAITQLIAYSLLDVITIIIITLLCNGKPIAHDANELNCYSIIFHLAYIPMRLSGVQPTLHNYACQALLVLLALRLMYFGKHTDDSEFKGLPIFGLLGLFRKWQESNHITSKAFNHLPSLLFFGSAVPLIFITTRTNDTSVTTTVAGLMTFVYLIATMINNQQIANKTTKNEIAANAIKSERNADTARLCELFRSRSEEEQALIIELLSSTFTKQNNPVLSHFNRIRNAETDLISEYAKRHYFLLARLMQILPGNITNQTTLTPEQVEMCLVVSKLAEKGVVVIEDGLALLDDLLFIATSSNDKKPPSSYDSFLAYLEEGAEFMRESAEDYGDVANHFKKKKPEARK